MNTTWENNNGGGGGIVLMFLAIVIVAAFLVTFVVVLPRTSNAPDVAAESGNVVFPDSEFPDVDSYEALPMSKHAMEGHEGEEWNAEAISEYFDNGGCSPKMYVCEAKDFNVHYCKINDGKSIGLIIGRTVRQIISGYMGSNKYWSNRCSQ